MLSRLAQTILSSSLVAMAALLQGCQPMVGVKATVPTDGAMNVEPTTPIEITFDRVPKALPQQPLTLSTDSGRVTASQSFDAMAARATLQPLQPLALSTRYTVQLDAAKASSVPSSSWTFTTRDVKSWAFVDGGKGLNWAPDWDTYKPQLTVLGDKLYAAWREMSSETGPMQLRVAVYNGDDRSPAWRFVDGGQGEGINRDPGRDAFDIQLTAFNGKLYAIWQEEAAAGSVIHVALYNGNDDAPAWTFVEGTERTVLNRKAAAIASYPQLTVFNDKLYATWMEENASARQVRVAVYGGNDAQPSWAFIDGNGDNGINQDPSHHGLHPQLSTYAGKLYAAWVENTAEASQIRVAVYNGNDAAPAWRFVSGTAGKGINHDPKTTAYYPQLTMFEAKLYAVWTERVADAIQVKVAVYNGDDAMPIWTLVDGRRTSNLNYDSSHRAYRPQLTAYGNKLYATWNEDDADGISRIRVAIYNGNDRVPAWSFLDGGDEKGLTRDTSHPAVDPQLTVYRAKLYLVWKQLIGSRGQKALVMVGE